MNALPHPEIIGLDVSRDWLDMHCLNDGHQLRLRNADEGYSELAKIAGDRKALVCFEAMGGHALLALAIRCCFENMPWPDFLEWRACRAAAA